MDITNDTKMQHVTDAVIAEIKRAAEHPLRASVIVRADVMLGILAHIERLESDLATAEQDSGQKQARIERLEKEKRNDRHERTEQEIRRMLGKRLRLWHRLFRYPGREGC